MSEVFTWMVFPTLEELGAGCESVTIGGEAELKIEFGKRAAFPVVCETQVVGRYVLVFPRTHLS